MLLYSENGNAYLFRINKWEFTYVLRIVLILENYF